jgi:hypothetical protein
MDTNETDTLTGSAKTVSAKQYAKHNLDKLTQTLFAGFDELC